MGLMVVSAALRGHQATIIWWSPAWVVLRAGESFVVRWFDGFRWFNRGEQVRVP